MTAADGVSFSVDAGELLVLVGASGSGKTTILNAIAGLTPVDSGRIVVCGLHVDRAPLDELIKLRRDHVAVIFQEFNLVTLLTVEENISLPLMLAGASRSEVADRVQAALRTVGLPGVEGRYPDELSGGQRQRIAIARSLAGSHPIVLADEPTGSVDTKTARTVMTALVALRNAGRTVIVATHDPAFADVADRVLTVRDGSIVQRAGANVAS